MSLFDTAMACTMNMRECLNQNHYELPPYGPVPDAASKLRMAVNNMVGALVIAMEAESRGITMPPVAELPEAEAEAMRAGVRQEHTLHREYAETLRDMPPPPDPVPLGQLPPEEQERQEQAKQDEERRQQEESEQIARERQAREQAAREQQERERQAAAQAPTQGPEPDKPANTFV